MDLSLPIVKLSVMYVVERELYSVAIGLTVGEASEHEEEYTTDNQRARPIP